MEDLVTRAVDAGLSILILVTWIFWLLQENRRLQARLDKCLVRFEKHLEEHEKIQ